MHLKFITQKYFKMKKIIFVLVAIITLTSCTQEKTAYVDTEKLVKDYKGTLAVEAEIKEKSDKFNKELEPYLTAFQKKVSDYQAKAPKMSTRKRAKKEQELGAEDQMIRQQQQQIQYQIQNEAQTAMKPVYEKVNEFIKDYGKTNGYKYIFGTVELNGSVMYGEEKSNLTDTILTALNDAYKKDDSSTEEKKEEPKTEPAKEEAKK